ncbi:hypothetical protein GCM10010441_22580 [Kitasatospora paracochleata]|uniref:Uncharacterized protein n=1 Tax=Kitasatospora paracochleata TaxID=58354 RepID=A0ABT1J1N7_9ACTN|nr:hypothetical protein [Kitasatospora paracochleata]MCP2311348.1 hypothetical protein [Kitasatospora paracochleata]
MTEQSGPQQRIADAIRPAMLNGLQDAQLIGAAGAERINQWVDWIAAVVAGHVVQPIAAERDAFADRVDTLTDVARRHREGYRDATRDVQLLETRVADLEAEVAQLRGTGVAHADPGAEADEPAQSLRDRLRARHPTIAEALDRRDAEAGPDRNAAD